jgi:hypothetical protein
MPLEVLRPLGQIPGVRLFNLQVGPDADRWRASPDRPSMFDLRAGRASFLDTAADIRALDAVVSVDTAIVHLAGALGCPTLVALPHSPDWRWQATREDTPWYRHMRLVRQTTPGDWPDVVRRLRTALVEMARARSRTAAPQTGSTSPYVAHVDHVAAGRLDEPQ